MVRKNSQTVMKSNQVAIDQKLMKLNKVLKLVLRLSKAIPEIP